MAPTPGVRASVAPPAPLAPVQTLFTGLVPQAMGGRLLAGIAHVQGRSTGPRPPQDACAPAALSITDHCAVGERTAFIVTAPELRPSQSTYVDSRRTMEERLLSAKFNMDRGLSFVVAREILYGTATQANAWGNPYLNDAPTAVGAGGFKARVAISHLIDAWAQQMLGERGVIHVPPAVLQRLLTDLVVEQRGTQFFERTQGHPVVTDAGYAGANATSAATVSIPAVTQSVFMSPNVDVLLSDYRYWPATPDEARMAVNSSANTRAVWVDRVVIYTWEKPAGGDTAPPVLTTTVDITA